MGGRIEKMRIRANGVGVTCHCAGGGDDAIVLLHGAGVDSAMLSWGEVIPLLSGRYRVIAPDLPGYGTSDRIDGEYTLAFYTEAVKEYYEHYPEDLDELKDFMLDMFQNATITARDSILLNRAADEGMLTPESASYLCKVDSYLFRGMLADVRSHDLDEDDFRWVTREFMDLIIRSYTTQLQEGYSILVVSPDFEIGKTARAAQERFSYRVKIIPVTVNSGTKGVIRATA